MESKINNSQHNSNFERALRKTSNLNSFDYPFISEANLLPT